MTLIIILSNSNDYKMNKTSILPKFKSGLGTNFEILTKVTIAALVSSGVIINYIYVFFLGFNPYLIPFILSDHINTSVSVLFELLIVYFCLFIQPFFLYKETITNTSPHVNSRKIIFAEYVSLFSKLLLITLAAYFSYNIYTLNKNFDFSSYILYPIIIAFAFYLVIVYALTFISAFNPKIRFGLSASFAFLVFAVSKALCIFNMDSVNFDRELYLTTVENSDGKEYTLLKSFEKGEVIYETDKKRFVFLKGDKTGAIIPMIRLEADNNKNNNS
ncbi:hypothetical protein NF27_FX00420 [Candidatus Jidaibacter acanthamoeba]|uniref:Uncharacterized protein n=1 Tax=Candidatus Jidaibacter acanthamoebae TaxID=86105 RepID=A0A0C1MXW6_9RICK|nr:hypothetical protein [Candidatus Jidaibacter acanthamoeba]KIE04781.1 hypothetical protein NF27_FX00420 [Candidatus Jidaibacter acanthamoeba]